MSIDKLNYLNKYEKANTNIYIKQVKSNVLTEFNNYIKKFSNFVKSIEDDELIENFHTYKYLLNNFILSLDDYQTIFEDSVSQEDINEITDFFNEIIQYGEEREIVVKALNVIKSIKNGEVKNKASEELINIIKQTNPYEKVAIVCSREFSNFKQKNVNSIGNQNIKFYTPNQLLKENTPFDTVIFIGPPYYFDKFTTIFQGHEIYYIIFDFFSYYNFAGTILKNNQNENSNIYKDVHLILENDNNNVRNVNDEIDLSSEQEYKMNKIIKKHKYSYTDHQERFDKGNLITFASEKYFIMSKSAKVRVLKLNSDKGYKNELNIEKLRFQDLKSGDWVLIKRDTDESLIINEAKKIIGEFKYNHYLEYVKIYKKALLEKLSHFNSLEDFKRELISNQIKLKDINTLKTWLTFETIKPQSLKEILEYLDFSNIRKQNVIDAATQINKTHITAGKQILKKLEENIRNIDYEYFFEEMSENKEYILNTEDKGEYFIEEIENISEQTKEFLKKDMNRIF
ncbi:hypothetical protein ABDK10_09790 [Staphylococcus aureus]